MNQNINLEALIAAYKNIATSTIGHVLDTGHIPHVFPMSPEQSLVGVIRTARLESKNASKLRDVLMSCQSKEVLIIDARYDLQRACWGEQRSVAAIHCDLAGVVVLGAITDRQALLKLKLPIFAHAVSCLTTRNEGESLVEMDTEIYINQFTVHSGDLLVADADGVFVLAIETAQQYLEQFQHLETEEKIKKDNFFRLNEINEYYF
ncbi:MULTISPECIES: RraA family protein [Acinetobacter]|jgi:regulator of RNase E activity RraA|uniref:RraA family protein n=1 Tax=Acinetobacter TaxID=469 RepID=UPI000C3EBF05|nr:MULTISPECIES: RraA family protein [Acinetobacter]MEC8567194.1 RraA family protein [Pseudomonadota bacterium]MBC69686.1 dimethylmenaquinone methyltransferase [Acinetobacter sp.]MBT50844.1 dimethylmenaquinone methyltransferase [Acinetobacter sp.]HIQ33110.1 RraA family protein [Acinetobacter venetianus]HJP49275.1 RraA family protein [Acinetobacter venetianus]|tara:strand:- start:960 stop:1577 length:618 start_codon:yes stop_codon:yes gene_type:complete